MLKSRQQPGDRRGEYSFRRHFARLKQEGRLPRIAAAVAAVMIAGGVTFGQCGGNSITGPSTSTTSAGGSVAPAASLTSGTDVPPPITENTHERDAVFTGVNPCNNEPVVAKGKRHDKFSLSFTATGNAQSDHHINDSFKSVPIDAQGVEVADPEFEYVGSDVHSDRVVVDALDGTVTHRELTNEHLSRRGGGDHWVLHVVQVMRFNADDLLNPTSVEIKGHASCPKAHCTLPNGCPEQAFTFVPTP